MERLIPWWLHRFPREQHVTPDACVYFFQEKTGGPIKIGMTRSNLPQRFSAACNASNPRLALVGIIRTWQPRALESALHAMSAVERIKGEWFEPSEALCWFILEHSTQMLEHEPRTTIGERPKNTPAVCEVCQWRDATTVDRRLCGWCLKNWAKKQNPGSYGPDMRVRKPLPASDTLFPLNPSQENAIRAMEDQ